MAKPRAKLLLLLLLLSARCECTTLELQRLCAGTTEPSLFHMGSCYVAIMTPTRWYTEHKDVTCQAHALGEKYVGHIACPLPGFTALMRATIFPTPAQTWMCIDKPDPAVGGVYAYYYNTSTKMADVDLPWTLFEWLAGFGGRPHFPVSAVCPSPLGGSEATKSHHGDGINTMWTVCVWRARALHWRAARRRADPGLEPMVDYTADTLRNALCEYRRPRGDGGPAAQRRFRRVLTGYRTTEALTISTSVAQNALHCVRQCAAEPLCHCASYSGTSNECHLAIAHCAAHGAVQPDAHDGTNAVYDEEPHE